MSFPEAEPHAFAHYFAGQLAQPKITILECLRQELQMEKPVFPWVPDGLFPENKDMRVRLAQVMLKFPELDEKKRLNIITGDESWSYRCTSQTSQWQTIVPLADIIPRSTTGTPKSTISAIFSLRGFLATKVLPHGRSFDSDVMVFHILREMEARIQENRLAKKLKSMTIHMDNARPSSSKRAAGEIERVELRRTSHPSSCPDISPREFWLCSLVKSILKGRKHTKGGDLLNSLLEIVTEIAKEHISDVYRKWIKRLHELIRTEGEYGSQWHNQFLMSF
jgi:hypothetical protein